MKKFNQCFGVIILFSESCEDTTTMATSQVPWALPGCPHCPHWLKPVSRSLVSAWSHSSGAEAVTGSGTEPRPACGREQTWTKVTAHSCSSCTSAFAQVLQTGIFPVLKTYVQTCHGLDFLLLRSVCWTLSHDKLMLNLPTTLNFVPSLLPSPPTNLSHLPLVSWLLHPNSQAPYSICYLGKYKSTCFWQGIKNSW